MQFFLTQFLNSFNCLPLFFPLFFYFPASWNIFITKTKMESQVKGRVRVIKMRKRMLRIKLKMENFDSIYVSEKRQK